MRPLQVVVRDELGEDRPEVLLVQDDEMVEALSGSVPITRSITAFARGLATGVAMASIPIRRARWRKSRPYTAS
jgi:hypothetical protein